jgi:serine/threonine protein kinase
MAFLLTLLIIFHRDGDCRLTDFGLAVSIHDEDGLGKMAGTRMYMAPERMCVEKYSFESDVYSLGLSLATVSLGYCPIPQVVGDFELLESAESLTTTLTEMATTESLESELLGFLVPMVEPHARDRPSIEALMATPFIRHQCPLWPSTDACSEVLKHLRMIVVRIALLVPLPISVSRVATDESFQSEFQESHKWSRRVEPTKVIEDIVRCRAEQNCMTPDLSILDLEPLAQELDMTTCACAHFVRNTLLPPTYLVSHVAHAPSLR